MAMIHRSSRQGEGVENREPVRDTRAGFYDLPRDKLDSLTVTLVHCPRSVVKATGSH